MTKPQEIQYGTQPAVNPVVVFGKAPAATEPESEPAHDTEATGGIVPEYAGGDPVPDREPDGPESD
jgi:hypothetical protein